ncbi:MAG: hypothetical protein GF307_14390 [candidate division Zixibacteria bacterium]|nr:hypothetical protein [candidate division Zixibacteria bacterium]
MKYLSMENMMNSKVICTIVIALIALNIPQAGAEDYTVGAGDVLTLNFWQQPDLNTVVTVRQDGKIAVPVIGELTVEGMTTSEIADEVVDKMTFYNPNISQATVVVTEFNSRTVYVTGQVNNPGELNFEVFPNVWEAIQRAGGATEEADLSRVRLIRGDTGKIRTLDIEKYLREGDLTGIPKLSKNDNVDIPRYALTGGEGVIPRDFEGRKVFFVYGAVARPGVMNLDQGLDVLDAIVLAGGPTEGAKLSKVRVISKANPYSQVATVNLDQYSKQGLPARIPLKPEDTIVVPRGQGVWGSVYGVIREVLPIIATTSATILAIAAYNNRD